MEALCPYQILDLQGISPDSNLEGKPLFTVKCLSFTLPPHAQETKVVTPRGPIAINTLAVFECLYCYHVADLATKFDGVSIFI